MKKSTIRFAAMFIALTVYQAASFAQVLPVFEPKVPDSKEDPVARLEKLIIEKVKHPKDKATEISIDLWVNPESYTISENNGVLTSLVKNRSHEYPLTKDDMASIGIAVVKCADGFAGGTFSGAEHESFFGPGNICNPDMLIDVSPDVRAWYNSREFNEWKEAVKSNPVLANSILRQVLIPHAVTVRDIMDAARLAEMTLTAERTEKELRTAVDTAQTINSNLSRQ